MRDSPPTSVGAELQARSATKKIWSPVLQRNQKILGWTEHGQGVPLQWATSVWGRRSRPNEPQRKSDTETRVDPKTSPVPRLEGNPPAVRRAFLFYGKKARRAVGI